MGIQRTVFLAWVVLCASSAASAQNRQPVTADQLAEAIAKAANSLARPTLAGLLPGEWLQITLIVAIVATTLLTIYVQAVASRAETFRNLRAGFEGFRNDLPPEVELQRMLEGLKAADRTAESWKAANNQWTALKKYWRHAFTEWYVTTQASPFFYRTLWKNYYQEALTEQCKEPAKVAALFAAAEVSSGARSDKLFLETVLRDVIVKDLNKTEIVRQAIQIAIELKVRPSETVQKVLKDKDHDMDFVADVDRWIMA